MKRNQIISGLLILLVGTLIGFSASMCNPLGDDPIEDTKVLRPEPQGLETFTGEICGTADSYSLFTNDLNPAVSIGNAKISNTEKEIVIDLEVQPAYSMEFAELVYNYEINLEEPVAQDPANLFRYTRYFEQGETSYRMVVPKEVVNGKENFSLEVRISNSASEDPTHKTLKAYVPGISIGANQVFEHFLKPCKSGEQPTEDSNL